MLDDKFQSIFRNLQLFRLIKDKIVPVQNPVELVVFRLAESYFPFGDRTSGKFTHLLVVRTRFYGNPAPLRSREEQ